MVNEIANNYQLITERVAKAAYKSGRKPDNVTIVGVTKTVGAEAVNSYLALGNRNVAENRVQELLNKYSQIGDKADWHMIGHLQTNKIKSVINKVKLIQSLDSFRLAAELNRHAREIEKNIDVLVEINIAGEDSKFGISPTECRDFISELLKFDGITVKGLMTVAPFVETPEENRIYFKKMLNLFIDNQKYFHNNIHMDYLSMGMTNDYEVAVEEGSTMIRVGTGIFGERSTKER